MLRFLIFLTIYLFESEKFLCNSKSYSIASIPLNKIINYFSSHINISKQQLQFRSKGRIMKKNLFKCCLLKLSVSLGLAGFVGLLSSCVQPEQTSPVENVESVSQELSASATMVFTISSTYLSSSGWGVNGSVYSDASNRCISEGNDAGTGFVRFSGLASCPNVLTAQLNFSTTEWDAVPNFVIRKVLKPIVSPAANFSGAASTSMIGWRYASDSAHPWDTLGAYGVGTDVSTEFVSGNVGYGQNIQHSVDVLSLVSGCLPTGACDLAMFSALASGQSAPAKHYWLVTGSPTLVFTCDAGVPVVCGDSVISGSEQCDDGGNAPGDGCSATCTVEAGFACSGLPSVCITTCGDGTMAGAEQCDDGNVISGDGCSSTCLNEVCTCSVP